MLSDIYSNFMHKHEPRPNILLLYPKTGMDFGSTIAPPHALLAVAAPLLKAGYKVTLLDQRVQAITSKTLQDFISDDLVCIGMPVHGGAPAVAFNAYVKKCKAFSGKKVCAFVTCRFTPWKSLLLMRKKLEETGAVVQDEFAFKGFFTIGDKKPTAFGQKVNAGKV